MKTVKGDLLDLGRKGFFDVIVHGCNCFHIFGAGIALQIKKQFPAAYDEDLKTARADPNKLGTFSRARIGELIVVNAYTQHHPGANCDYSAITRVFSHINGAFGHLRIGYPRIGAGIAGGDWERISFIIDEALEGCDHTLVVFES